MNDKTIRAGDLVMVVKPRECGCVGRLGTAYKVSEILLDDATQCPDCGEISITKVNCVDGEDGCSAAAYRLIKINPPAKDTETEREKEAV